MRTEVQDPIRDRASVRGAVLMDIMVGLSILAIAAGGIFAGFKASLTAWATAQQFAGEQHNARTVLDWTVRRLRAAGSGYAGVPFSVAAANEVWFIGDTNGDGALECHRIFLNTSEGVVYSRSVTTPVPVNCTGTDVPLTASAEARGLTVTGLQMQYFDGELPGGQPLGYAQLASDPLARSNIRRIRVTIQVRGLQSPDAFTMSTDVHIRR